MTKKDFQLIADIIKAMPDFAPSLRAQKDACAKAFADKLATTNPLFDRKRFLAACGF